MRHFAVLACISCVGCAGRVQPHWEATDVPSAGVIEYTYVLANGFPCAYVDEPEPGTSTRDLGTPIMDYFPVTVRLQDFANERVVGKFQIVAFAKRFVENTAECGK